MPTRRTSATSTRRQAGLWLAAGLLLCASGLARADDPPPAGGPPGAAGPPSVGIDMTKLDAATYRRLDALTLERRLVVRLVQEGLAVVAPSRYPSFLVVLHAVPGGLGLEVRGAAGVAPRRVFVALREKGSPEVHLEIVHHILGLVRAALHAAPAATQRVLGAAPAAPPPPPVSAPPAVPERVTARPAPPLELGPGLGALVRGTTADLQPRLSARWVLGRALAAVAETAFSPASSPRLSVYEWQLQLGAGYRRDLGPHLQVGGDLLAGALLHRYATRDPLARDPDGTEVDFLASLAVGVTVAWGRHLALVLRAAPGLASRAREHLEAAAVVWRRSAWRLETGAALVWRP